MNVNETSRPVGSKEDHEYAGEFIRLTSRQVDASPYYEIEYTDLNGEHRFGYASYSLDVISNYLRNNFGFGGAKKLNNHFLRQLVEVVNNTAIYGEDFNYMTQEFRKVCESNGLIVEDTWSEGKWPIVDIGFKPTVRNALLRSKINYLDEIMNLTLGEVMKLKGIGPTALEEIIKAMIEKHIWFKEDTENE